MAKRTASFAEYVTAKPLTFRFVTIPVGTAMDSALFRAPSARWIASAIASGIVVRGKSAPIPDGDTPSPSVPPSETVPQPVSDRTSRSRNTSRKS